MKHVSRSCQRGSATGKLLFLVACVAAGFAVKNQLSSDIDGQTQASLQAQMGEPISKEQIPRPR
jgi:hypothetical protein